MAYTRLHWVESETPLSAQNMNNIEDGVEEALSLSEGNSDMWAYIRNLVYPVGSIYMSVNNTNPGTLFGGTWVAWGAGKVPVGVNANETAFDSVEKTGGRADAIVPYHRHSVDIFTSGGSGQFNSSNVVGTVNHEGQVSVRKTGTNTDTIWEASGAFQISQGASASALGGASGAAYTNVLTLGINTEHYHTIPSHTHSIPAHNTNYTGTSVSNANLQPYITCYMWKRTA